MGKTDSDAGDELQVENNNNNNNNRMQEGNVGRASLWSCCDNKFLLVMNTKRRIPKNTTIIILSVFMEHAQNNTLLTEAQAWTAGAAPRSRCVGYIYIYIYIYVEWAEPIQLSGMFI